MGTGEFGTESVRANIEPEKGGLASYAVTSFGINRWYRFVTTYTPIEGVVIKAAAANTSTVYVTGAGGDAATAFPLAAGETVSIAIDDLTKVNLYFAAASDSAYALVITHTGD